MLVRARGALVTGIRPTRRRLAIWPAITRQLMNQITNTAILHLDLLDLLILVRTVPIWPTLIQLALRLPVVAFHRCTLSLPVGALVYRLFLLHLLEHHVLLAQALLIQRRLNIALEVP